MENIASFDLLRKLWRAYFNRDKQIERELKILKKNIQYYASSILCFPFAIPDNATIHVTYQCNLNCPICEIINIPKRDKLSAPEYNLTTPELESIAEQIKKMGIAEVMLTGGEPLLRHDLINIVDLCIKQGIEVDITTNGTIINEKTARDIASSKIRHIQVSIDSLNPEINDTIRGKAGSFLKAIEGINSISKHKVIIKKTKYDRPTIGINTVIIDKNLQDLVGMVGFFKKMEVIQIVYLPFVTDTSNLQNIDSASSFWPKKVRLEALDSAIDQLVKLKQSDGNFINPHQQIEYLSLLKKYYRNEIEVSKFRCLSALNRVVIGPNGDVAYCGGSFGNLRKKSLSGIWYSNRAWQARKQVKKCKNPCLQVCMGKTECENIKTIFNSFTGRVKKLY